MISDKDIEDAGVTCSRTAAFCVVWLAVIFVGCLVVYATFKYFGL